MGKELFVVGKYIECDCGKAWEIAGVFDREEKAVEACISDNYFVGPIAMNEPFPDESVKWPGAYYPSC
jgi:hypothetical protein